MLNDDLERVCEGGDITVAGATPKNGAGVRESPDSRITGPHATSFVDKYST